MTRYFSRVFAKKRFQMILTILFTTLSFSAMACKGFPNNEMVIGQTTLENTNLLLLDIQAKKANQPLIVRGDSRFIQILYGRNCQMLPMHNYHGVNVQLPDSGEEYDGRSLLTFQQVYGGRGDDTIMTGSDIDYVYAGEGDDKIYTYASFDKVDAGTGLDCVEKGTTSNGMVENISNHELNSCGQHAEMVSIVASCPESGSGNTSLINQFQSNGVWIIESLAPNSLLQFNQLDTIVTMTNIGPSGSYCASTSTLKTSAIVAHLTNSNDYLNASKLNIDMSIYGFEGNDTIITGDGNDFIIGGSGSDTIEANDGIDWILGDYSVETEKHGLVWSLPDNGSAGKDRIHGGKGHDVIFGNGESDNISGGDGDDLIFGNGGKTDNLSGNDDDDVLVASGGTSWSNRAKLYGGNNNDLLVCDDGDCFLGGGGSRDLLLFLSDDDDVEFSGGGGSDIMYNRGDSFPAGTGGADNDECYDCGATVVSATNKSVGGLTSAVWKANNLMNSPFEATLDLGRYLNLTQADVKENIADLVDYDAFHYWLTNRNTNIHTLQTKK